MRERKVRAVVVGVAVLALGAVVGCTPSGTEASEGAYPLDELYEAMRGPTQLSAERDAEFRARFAREQELIAACMAEQGFSYVPFVAESTSITVGGPAGEDGLEPGTVEYAEQYGYGMFTGGGREEVPLLVDPNEAIRAAMEGPEQREYDWALRGIPAEYREDGTLRNPWTWDMGGCASAAEHQVYDVEGPQAELNAVLDDPRWVELVSQMDALYLVVEQDPRKLDLDLAWSDCLADAGYPDLGSPTDAAELLEAFNRSLWNAHAGEEDFTDLSAAEKSERQEFEIALAVADTTCQVELGYENQRRAVMIEAQETFAADNRTEIEEFLRALEAVG